MKEKEFLDWLVETNQQANSAQSVVSRVKRIEEAYPDLDSRFEDKTIETLLSIFTYTKEDEAKKREPLHKIEITGNIYNGTQTLRNALAKYIEFRRDEKTDELVACDSKEANTKVLSPKICKVYKIDEFLEWMPEYGSVKQSSASSYISYLKALGRNVTKESDGVGILEYITDLLRKNYIALSFDVLEKVDEKLSLTLSSPTVSSAIKKDINNWRSSLRKYIEFLQDEIEDIPDEDELQEVITAVPTLAVQNVEIDELGDGDMYTFDDIKKNFAFRLNTQNRMSNEKEIFYPISIIRKLFYYSQRKGKSSGTLNTDYEWYKDWIKEYVGEINVLIKNEKVSLSDIKALTIFPFSENVYIRLSGSDINLQVFTETAGDCLLEPMKAKSLNNIHIDHTPLMAKVLSDNISLTPALNVLSKEIKTVAKANRIDIKTKNFGKISRMIFANQQFVDEHLLTLIPALKEELNLLRNKCTLTLMQASHNLRKKSEKEDS